MVNTKDTFVISPAVDVYKIGDDTIEFYFVDTRRRVTLAVSENVISLIHSMVELKPLIDHLHDIDLDFDKNIEEFLDFLVKEKIILIQEVLQEKKRILKELEINRYDRQLSYFESLFHESAYTIQNSLFSLKVLVFGVGAVGAGIVQQLSMCGIRNFVLIDKDVISEDSIERHFFFKRRYVGMPKVDALADFLRLQDSLVQCTSIHKIIDFDTSIDEYIHQADFVINTMDEPYLGITSLKIGRACFAQNKPLYVAGGFDAHLMSTGELVIPYETPCVDCYTNYFTTRLKDWKPHYNVNAVPETELRQNIFEVGGLSSMTLWAVSYAAMVILQYIATGKSEVSKGRGELLFEELKVNYLNIPKNRGCHVCGDK